MKGLECWWKRKTFSKELASLPTAIEASMSKYFSGERTSRIYIVVNIVNSLCVTFDELIGHDIEDDKMEFVRLKTLIAWDKECMFEDDKKELIKFLLEN